MKKLAIIGASYLQLPLVQKAKALGVETHCFAWEEGAVCKELTDFFYPISVLEKEMILEKCQKIGVDGITSIATDMAVPTISFVAEKMGLVSNSFLSALISTDKALMRNRFQESDVNSPKYKVIDSSDTVALQNLNFPLIVKPVDRSGSRGIQKVETNKEINVAIEIARKESFSGKLIVEEFIEGKEISVEGISFNGNHSILAITDKVTTGAPHFVELAHHQPSSLPKSILEEIEQETVKALNALEIRNGASHSEFKITEKGEIFIIEVGARMGGDFIGSHLVKLTTGFDYIEAVIKIALNCFEGKVNISEGKAAGVYFLSEENKSILPFFQKENLFDVEKAIQKQQLIKVSNSNDRSGYLIYQNEKKINLF